MPYVVIQACWDTRKPKPLCSVKEHIYGRFTSEREAREWCVANKKFGYTIRSVP